MKKHTQIYRHEPDKGQYGDCHRTALACLLDLETPEDAPHFIGEYETIKAIDPDTDYCWQVEQEKWLNSLGYTTVDVSYNGEAKLEDVFSYMQSRNPETLYLLGGTSPRGTNHSVICHGGGFYHDPHPDGGFVHGPLSNGMWEITFILPVLMKEAIR